MPLCPRGSAEPLLGELCVRVWKAFGAQFGPSILP